MFIRNGFRNMLTSTSIYRLYLYLYLHLFTYIFIPQENKISRGESGKLREGSEGKG